MDDPGVDFSRRQDFFLLFAKEPRPPPRTAGGFSLEIKRLLYSIDEVFVEPYFHAAIRLHG